MKLIRRVIKRFSKRGRIELNGMNEPDKEINDIRQKMEDDRIRFLQCQKDIMSQIDLINQMIDSINQMSESLKERLNEAENQFRF